jgi:hypothetical protein
MTAKQYLQQAYRLNGFINADRAELVRLRELSVSVGGQDLTQDRVQTSITSDKTGNVVMKIMDLESKIKAEIARYVDLQAEIRGRVNAVQCEDLRLLLKKRYLNFEKWEQIAVDMNYAYRWVLALHKRALTAFEEQFSGGIKEWTN